MFKNTAGQSVTLSEYDSTTGLQKTGDSANILLYVDKDDAGPVLISSNSGVPTEISSTNSKGDYKIALSQAETNADKLHFTGNSSVANMVVVSKTIYTVPANFTSLNISNNAVDANVARLLGTAWLAPAVPGTPDVNAKQIGGQTASLNANNLLKVSLNDILATALTETSGQLTAGFKKFFNVASPTSTMNEITLVDTVTTYTGNTVQTGDAFARLGAPAGVSIAADLAEIEAETDGIAAIPTNPYTGTPPTAAAIATAVWQDSTASDFTTASSIGKSLYNAFGANTSVFTVAALANAPTGGSAPTAAQVATAVWQDLLSSSDFSITNSIGALIKNNLNVAISSLQIPAQVTSLTVFKSGPQSASLSPTTIINMTMTVGEDKTFIDPIVQPDGISPQNVTSWTANLVIHKTGDKDMIYMAKTCSLYNLPGSQFPNALRADISSADTSSLIPGQYSHYWLRTDSGNETEVSKGLFTLLDN